MRALLAAAALTLGCLDDARPSDGSSLEGPIVWTGEARQVSAGGALSVTLMATGAGTLSLGVRDGARVLVDPAAPELSPNRVLRGRGLVVGMIPSASASLPLAASLEVSAVHLDGAGPLALSAWIKRADKVPAVQALALSVVRAAPVSSPALAAALAEVRRIWRPAGIEIGDPSLVEAAAVGQVAVDPELGSDSPAVGEALRLSSLAPATLALVVVGDVVLAGNGIWALSGGIPVPPVPGTARSGVLVSGVLVERDPVFAGQVIAHEVGHALGLYHTTEAVPDQDGAPALHDQIDDTPDGAGNLMFWAAVRGGTRLTPGQGEIARRSALAR